MKAIQSLITILLLVLCAATTFAQHPDTLRFSIKTRVAVDSLAKRQHMFTSYTNLSNSRGNDHLYYRVIREQATDEELIELVNHASTTGRCLAFLLLMERPQVDVYAIVERHLNDRETITFYSGCLVYIREVKDCFISVALYHRKFNHKQKVKVKKYLSRNFYLHFDPAVFLQICRQEKL